MAGLMGKRLDADPSGTVSRYMEDIRANLGLAVTNLSSALATVRAAAGSLKVADGSALEQSELMRHIDALRKQASARIEEL